MDYLLLALQSVLSVFGIRAAYEQPKYEVLARVAGGVEVRQYAPRLAAETTVRADDDEAARGEAFNRLAKYIFGANRAANGQARGSEKIAMTSPVQTAGGGAAKIAMTSPVQTGPTPAAARQAEGQAGDGDGEGMTMRFFLPRKLTAQTAPVPNDTRVRVVTVPSETVAVLRFNGSWDDGMLGAKRSTLLQGLEGTAWAPTGEAYTLFYDPPFSIPFLRRNEVAVNVERRVR